MDSKYFDQARTAEGVAANKHRELVGGLWDEVGSLQLSFLRSRGLEPHHRLLDVGCGCLRGGVHFVRFLDAGNYYGIDLSRALLEAGYDIELVAAGLRDRLPRSQLLSGDKFDVDRFGVTFDFAIAQSVFTHLTFNRIRQCLQRVARVMKPGGAFYASVFELPDGVPADQTLEHLPGRMRSNDVEDPYHYSVADFEHAIRGLPWELHYLGDWDHPRGQRMLEFIRVGEEAASAKSEQKRTRDLSIIEAARLMAGAEHYRAYVGPPNRYDFMGATQFSLLFQNGLRDHHRVLDFGCGSLRLGRLLIPYLQRGRYFGIEPNRWLIDDAFDRELGRDIVVVKQPFFSDRNDFDCSVFGQSFHFVIAQSILTHCGPDLIRRLLRSTGSVLEPDGLILFDYRKLDSPYIEPKAGWHYPSSVGYTESAITQFIGEAGLVGMSIPWYHPAISWHLAARSGERLPSESEKELLRGAVLFDPQFRDSRQHRCKADAAP